MRLRSSRRACSARPSRPEPVTFGPLHGGPFVAWVKDVKEGEVAVMVGEQTIVHKDANLAKQLAEIAARASRS